MTNLPVSPVKRFVFFEATFQQPDGGRNRGDIPGHQPVVRSLQDAPLLFLAPRTSPCRARPMGLKDESLGVVVNHSSFGKQSFVHRCNLGAVHMVLKDTAQFRFACDSFTLTAYSFILKDGRYFVEAGMIRDSKYRDVFRRSKSALRPPRGEGSHLLTRLCTRTHVPVEVYFRC